MEFFNGASLVFAGATIAALFGFIGSTLGMGYAGQAAAGAASEKPNLFGKLLLLQSLPGTQGIYGLVGAFLILSFSGVLLAEEVVDITVAQGMQYLIAGIPLGFAGLLSGMFQGKVSAAGVAMIARDESQVAKAMIFSAMVETWAIFGLIISFFLLMSIGG